jgi:DnaJ-class molecular chaperone
MGGEMQLHAYKQLIAEDIAELRRYMPEHSLEMKHIIEVLKWSIDELYSDYPNHIREKVKESAIHLQGNVDGRCTNCDGKGYVALTPDAHTVSTHICQKCHGSGKEPDQKKVKQPK